jgi:hypothetical protein
MISPEDTLYFHSIRSQGYDPCSVFWKEMRSQVNSAGKFYIDISKKFNRSRFVTRNGEWSLPFKQELIPGFEMPDYDATFTKTFEQVTDEKALKISKEIKQGKKFAVMYSGGIDSTTILVSLIKNLSKEELSSIVICCSGTSIIENPLFWKNHIDEKIKYIDTQEYWYDDIIKLGYTPITGDEGDCVFGTIIGTELYHNYDFYSTDLSQFTRKRLTEIKYKISDPEIHFSEYKDIIIKHLAYDHTTDGIRFGKILYEKYVHNINTATNICPIISLHDFFWWLIFNVKYLNCSVRGPIYYNIDIPVKDCIDKTVNWYNDIEYQLWSMANNNNGEKIKNTLATYKFAARKYIYDFDKNEYYFYFKTKLESLGNLLIRNDKSTIYQNNLGMDKNYNRITTETENIKTYFLENFSNYKIDWC